MVKPTKKDLKELGLPENVFANCPAPTEPGLTIMHLYVRCREQVLKGNGNKIVLLSDDDEGNGFHTLFMGFTEDVDQFFGEGGRHDTYGLSPSKPTSKNSVILG